MAFLSPTRTFASAFRLLRWAQFLRLLFQLIPQPFNVPFLSLSTLSLLHTHRASAAAKGASRRSLVSNTAQQRRHGMPCSKDFQQMQLPLLRSRTMLAMSRSSGGIGSVHSSHDPHFSQPAAVCGVLCFIGISPSLFWAECQICGPTSRENVLFRRATSAARS